MPVPGEWRPATPTQAGSSSEISAAVTRRSPGTPFARPRASSASRRGSSSRERATISLPQRSCGIACSSQNAYMAREPSTQRRAFADPGT